MTHLRPHHLEPCIETARVALVYKAAADQDYSHTGLGRTAAATAKALRSSGMWAEIWGCVSGEALLARLRVADAAATKHALARPTHVVVYAPWIPAAEIQAMASEVAEVAFIVTSHSNFGFLGADPHAVKLMREIAELQLAHHNIFAGGNCEKFARAASQILGVRVACLPNLVDLREHLPAPRRHTPGDSLRLGLFGAARILKNGLTAAAAAVELAQMMRVPIELHINTGRDEGGTVYAIAELVSGVPNLTLVNDGWLPWAKFQSLLHHMHLVLQPSYTESFNCVVAEAIKNGVPAVGSDAIDWLPPRWQAIADDAGDVARVAEYLLRSPSAIEDGRRALERYMATGLRRWHDFLCAKGGHA
jgi:glycosyltransferase involved in cell wall biosynthesis